MPRLVVCLVRPVAGTENRSAIDRSRPGPCSTTGAPGKALVETTVVALTDISAAIGAASMIDLLLRQALAARSE